MTGGLRPGAGRPRAEVSRAREREAARARREGRPAPLVADGEVLLPSKGPGGRAPAWPLTKASARERVLWQRAWRKPQAWMWRQMGTEEQVAQYCRLLARAEQPDSPIGLAGEVRRHADALGLTAPGMRMLRWRIASSPAGKPARSSGTVPTPPSSVPLRDRLKVVDWRVGGPPDPPAA